MSVDRGINNGFVISARSLPISDRVEQRAAGRAVREGRPNQFWTRIRLPAKHVDPAHNRGKSTTTTTIILW